MSCSNFSVKTKTGTFTAYTEKVSKCEAEKRCKKRGEILAPIANRRDAKKILKLFKSNTDENCPVSLHGVGSFWLGLDVTYTENEQERVFSNGVKWDEKKHSKIYHNYLDGYTECAKAIFSPYMHDEENGPFEILDESEDCVLNKLRYLCLKPAADTSAEPIVQKREYEASSVLLPAVFFVAVSVFLAFGYVGVHKIIELKKENSLLKQKVLPAGVIETYALNMVNSGSKDEN